MFSATCCMVPHTVLHGTKRLTCDDTCLVCMQFAGYILEKLPHMKSMASDVFERKVSHLALLGTLLNLYNGPAMLKLDSTRAGGLTFLSKRTNVPVRSSSNAMDCSAVFDIMHGSRRDWAFRQRSPRHPTQNRPGPKMHLHVF